ncbi:MULTISPECIES: hypothetical protein [unclassified Pseudomonas]|jgi:hypothetical protein|nr:MULTISPECIES: hypothetical protein [unclassified Pseudomonas]
MPVRFSIVLRVGPGARGVLRTDHAQIDRDASSRVDLPGNQQH